MKIDRNYGEEVVLMRSCAGILLAQPLVLIYHLKNQLFSASLRSLYKTNDLKPSQIIISIMGAHINGLQPDKKKWGRRGDVFNFMRSQAAHCRPRHKSVHTFGAAYKRWFQTAIKNKQAQVSL